MKKILLSFLLIFNISVYASDFFDLSEDDLKEDLKVAKEDGKKGIMLFFTMENCPYCERMKKHTFADEKVISLIKDNFLVFEIDIYGSIEIKDFDGEKSTHKEFAEISGAYATPTVSFFDLNGKNLVTQVGMLNETQMLIMGDYVINGHYKESEFIPYLKKMLRSM
jgi:thioredoxin-related protein